MLIFLVAYFAVPENIHTPPPPHRRDWNFQGGGLGGSLRPKKLKKCIKLIGIPRGVGVLKKNPFRGEVCIFSGTTHFDK